MTQSPVLLPFRVLATLYTDVFRGMPLLLVVFIVGFGVPALDLKVISNQSPAVYGCVALTLTYTAYVAEVFRAGIFSVPQRAAARRALPGPDPRATMRRVILPQAVRTVIPPLLNDFISLQKDTALVSHARRRRGGPRRGDLRIDRLQLQRLHGGRHCCSSP